MKKLNFKKIATIATGAAVGAVVGNGLNTVANKFTASMDPKTGAIVRGLGLIVLGTVGPDMIGKGDVASTAGAVIAGKGVEQVLKMFVPSLVSGPDDLESMDGIDGEEFDDISGIGDLGEQIIEGPDDLVASNEHVSGAFA